MSMRARIGEQVIHETVEDDVLVIHLPSATYFGLRGVGQMVWSLVQRSATVEEIVDAAVSRFEGTRASIEAAIRGFLAELAAEALVVLEPAPRGLATAGPADFASLSSRLPFSLPQLEKFTDLRHYLLRP